MWSMSIEWQVSMLLAGVARGCFCIKIDGYPFNDIGERSLSIPLAVKPKTDVQVIVLIH